MIFRLSQKLNAKIKAGSLGPLPLNENPFADWSALVFIAGRTQYILLSNSKSLYSTVMFGKGITNTSHFIERAVSSNRELVALKLDEWGYGTMIGSLLDACQFVLNDQGEPQSSYWLASQIMELKLWRASEATVRDALNQDIQRLAQDSRFVYIGDDEFALREWTEG